MSVVQLEDDMAEIIIYILKKDSDIALSMLIIAIEAARRYKTHGRWPKDFDHPLTHNPKEKRLAELLYQYLVERRV